MPTTRTDDRDPLYRPLALLLEAHRARHPDKAAIVDVDRDVSINFAELAAVVDGAALQLQRHGVTAGTRVVLVTGTGIETVLMWLALWRLAAVVCPLDASQLGTASAHGVFASMRPALLLHGLQVELPIRHEGTRAPAARFGDWPAAALPDTESNVIRLAAAPLGVTLRARDATPDDLAAMCCTSGSSGSTKIVVHDHASYWLNGLDSIEFLGQQQDDRTLEYRSFGWYSSHILSLMPFLQTGATLHVARQFSLSRFAEWIERYRITVAVGVPTVINLLLTGPIDALAARTKSLRVMTCSSAPLIRVTWERFEQVTGIPLINLYGSTEAGWICGNRLHDRRIGTVGKPAPHAVFDVVDAEGITCAPGVAGQVVADGPKVAVGLLQVDGSLQPLRGMPCFLRDLAMRDSDGYVYLLDRMDDLVIRGGIKVSPQEIEEALLTHVDVAEAVAVGVPDAIYGQDAICFVVLRDGAQSDAAELQVHAAALLPREKLPKAIHIVDALPRNARGKLQRNLLRKQWRAPTADTLS